MIRGAGAGRVIGAQARRGCARGAQQERRACVGARTGAAGSWVRGRGALECEGARQEARRADARACRGALAALRHGRGARPRHGHERATCARRLGQLGQVGVLCTLTQFLDPV